SGTYIYAINEINTAVQGLRLSTNTLNDVFSYTMLDSAGTTATANLTVTIHGANVAPKLNALTVLVSPASGSVSLVSTLPLAT
ncbi:VCBS domain-containing protein, partial [Rhizobium ruizarguesonis]